MAASTVLRSARVPARWPSATGRPWRSAQRPFPSMMIATARARSSRWSAYPPRGFGAPSASNLQDFGFLALEQLVDLLRVLVRQLLDALLGPVLLVLADLALVDELLQVVDDVAPHVADGNAPVLGHPADDLHELLAPLLRELRDRQADQLAVVRRRQAQVGLLDRPLDGLERVRIEGLHGEHPDRKSTRLNSSH